MRITLLKNTLFITFITFLMAFTLNAQTTYTYTGTGNWTDTANWSPSYPGTIINSGDTVIIDSSAILQINLNISNDGQFNNDGTLNISTYFDNSESLINNGIINGSSIFNNKTLTNNGTISLYDSLNNNGFCFIFNYGIIDTYILTNDGTLDNSVSGTFNITFGGTLNNGLSVFNGLGIINNYGILNNNLGTINNGDPIGSGFINNYGTLNNIEIYNRNFIRNFEGGTLNNNEGLLSNISGATLINDGVLNNSATLTNEGSLVINTKGILTNNGSLDIVSSGTLTNTGTLNGINTSHTGEFSNAGILSPGNSPGTYTFNDTYTHESTASFQIELESITNFDNVSISNTNIAFLNGTLDVTLLNGFTPSVGDTFTILTAGTVIGTFATTNLPSGYIWSVNYSGQAVILEVTSTLSTSDFNVNVFELYPNPAMDQFTIQLDIALKLEKVNIYNMLGQAVLTTKETNINTSKLGSGTYIVEVITNKGKTTKRLILQ